MSANLLDGIKPELLNGATKSDGIISIAANTGSERNVVGYAIPGQSALSANQTCHIGISLRAASGGNEWTAAVVACRDAAENLKAKSASTTDVAGDGAWHRHELSIVVPSGMHITRIYFNQKGSGSAIDLANPTLSYGSAVCLASSAHTPYATEDHVSVTYATKASLKVTDDSIKAEVSARAQTDQNVADLSSRLTQTENSLTSEISDRRSAITTVTGLANAAQSTADGAAKQANLYTIGLGDAGAVAKWIHLGTLTSAGDASSATIAIVFGAGYNGGANQNSALTITIKDGYQWPPSTTGACGVSVMRENCDDALVDVLAQSATVYDVWVYAPWWYSEGRYSISGQYAAWQHSGATQKAEPATSETQVKQDVAYRLADATKAQTMATKNYSSIKQLSDSITSLVKGESTYTDPDGKSATSGIYSLVTQTRDSVTALFGQYTKTDDLAATDAVKDAKKAGTDAASAASAAQSTADTAKANAATAQSTANAAKGTADSLATMIREDATGITVGKSADGQTYSTGRTRMTDSAFQVLDKAGVTIAQLASDGVSFLAGLVRIVAGKATLPGNETVNSIVIDAGDGVAALHGTISRLDATINGIKSSVSAGWEQDFGSGVVLVSQNTSTNEASAFAVYPDGVRVNGLSVSQDAHHSTHSANLNNEDYGVYTFEPGTVGNPTGNGYGYCITVSSGNGGTNSYWRQQVALVNTSGIYTRECINPASGSGWTSWRRMTYYNKPLTPIYRLYNPHDSQHMFVSSESEYNSLVSQGWTGEGVAFYAFTSTS